MFKVYIKKKDYAGGIVREEIKSENNAKIWKLSSNENILGGVDNNNISTLYVNI